MSSIMVQTATTATSVNPTSSKLDDDIDDEREDPSPPLTIADSDTHIPVWEAFLAQRSHSLPGIYGRDGYLLLRSNGSSPHPLYHNFHRSHTVLGLYRGRFQVGAPWTLIDQMCLLNDETVRDDEVWWIRARSLFRSWNYDRRGIHKDPILIVDTGRWSIELDVIKWNKRTTYRLLYVHLDSPEPRPTATPTIDMLQRPRSAELYWFEQLKRHRYSKGLHALPITETRFRKLSHTVRTLPSPVRDICSVNLSGMLGPSLGNLTTLITIIQSYVCDCEVGRLYTMKAMRRIAGINSYNLHQSFSMEWLIGRTILIDLYAVLAQTSVPTTRLVSRNIWRFDHSPKCLFTQSMVNAVTHQDQHLSVGSEGNMISPILLIYSVYGPSRNGLIDEILEQFPSFSLDSRPILIGIWPFAPSGSHREAMRFGGWLSMFTGHASCYWVMNDAALRLARHSIPSEEETSRLVQYNAEFQEHVRRHYARDNQ